MALGKACADRQVMHDRLREHALAAWSAIREGQPNPLGDALAHDPELVGYLPAAEISGLMNVDRYVGDAPQRAHALAGRLRQV